MATKPNNIEAEQAVIGAVLINPSVIHLVDLEPEEFFRHRHKKVWEVFLELLEKEEPINDLTVLAEKLESVDFAYLSKLVGVTPSSANAEAYARIVRDKATRRETIEEANALATAAFDDETDVVEVRTDTALRLSGTKTGDGAVPFDIWLSDGQDLLEMWAENPSDHAGLETGLGDLDKVFGDGIMKGLNLLLGPPGVGKSILAQNIAVNWAEKGIPNAYYAGEMNWKDVYLRIMSDKSNQKVSSMRKGTADYAKIVESTEAMENLPLFVHDPNGMTTGSLRADLTRLKMQHGIKAVTFDFLTDLVDLPGLEEWKRAAKLAVRVQRILVELDLCGLFIHEMTKAGWTKKDMAGISGGKKVAHRAVCAVMIGEHIPPRGEEPNDDIKTVINIKPPRHVEGYKKIINLYKDPDYPRFGQVTFNERH